MEAAEGEKMKGIILAGGTGSRIKPLTLSTNKHLLAIYDKPMIYYPIETLKKAGITEILVITGIHHAGSIFSLLGSGKQFGVNFSFRVQDEAGGIPEAIGLAENFVGTEKFVSINGDNILFENIKPFIEEFEKGKEKSRILLYETSKEEAVKAGVAVLDGENVKEVIEKPKDPPTNWVVIGVYMYTPDVFKIIKNLKPSNRGELEIADIHNQYIKSHELKASKIVDKWLDAGSFDELLRASNEVKEYFIRLSETNSKKWIEKAKNIKTESEAEELLKDYEKRMTEVSWKEASGFIHRDRWDVEKPNLEEAIKTLKFRFPKI